MKTKDGRSDPGSFRTYFLAVILLVAGLLVYLWGHIQTMEQGQKLARLREAQKVLMQKRAHLKARVTHLKRSSRIKEIAVQELGMVFPDGPPKNLYLNAQPGGSKPGTRGMN